MNLFKFRLLCWLVIPQATHELQHVEGAESDVNKVHQLFSVIYEWKHLDFEYDSYVQRQAAISNRDFISENNLPLGVDVYGDRVFLTTPRWKEGVPVSLSVLPAIPLEQSPALRPYPSWNEHGNPLAPDCHLLMSVYRTAVDAACKRLWLIDAGVVNATSNLNQVCPPKIVVYDLVTNSRLVTYEVPSDQVRQDSLHSNIVVDVDGDDCDNAHAYVTDVWRYGLVVFSLGKRRSWRVTNYRFSPSPEAADFNVFGLNFQWLDGVFGVSLTAAKSGASRQLYFHPMASYEEFAVSTALLKDEAIWTFNRARDVANYFITIGNRGRKGQSSTSAIARNGVQFFTQVHRDTIGCWDTAKSYGRLHLADLTGQQANSNVSLIQFPNDMKLVEAIDGDKEHIWVVSNRLPIYLYSQLDYSDVNFRILRADVNAAIRGTICDPQEPPYTQSENNVGPAISQAGQC